MNSNYILIDIGNSRIKFLIDDNYFAISYSDDYILQLNTIISNFDENNIIVYSAVNQKVETEILNLLSIKKFKVINISDILKIQVIIDTSSVSGIGADRVLGIIGAYRHGVDSFITIDMGTATTINYVFEKKIIGGSIMPGAITQLKSLSQISHFLNFDSLSIDGSTFGNDTYSAINSGIFLSTIGAIDKALLIANNKMDKAMINNIFITGGLAKLFLPHLSKQFNYIYRPNLILEGIAKLISSYND